MISKFKVILIAVTLFWCDALISGTHAQQAQPQTQAVQLIGLMGVKPNAKGKLTVINGILRFIHAGGNADVPTTSVEDVVTGKDSQRVIGGTLGTISSLAVPYGGGRVMSLFRKKLDTLTIQYRDSEGGLHGAIFTMSSGQAEAIKKELLAQGARTSITTQADPNKTPSDSKEKKP